MFRQVLQEIIKYECDNSQKILSQKTGIPTSTINAWYKGKTEPNSSQLLILANHFNLTCDYLLGRESDETVKQEIEKRREMRPSMLKLVDICEMLNDMGISSVLGYITRMIEDNPEYLTLSARAKMQL